MDFFSQAGELKREELRRGRAEEGRGRRAEEAKRLVKKTYYIIELELKPENLNESIEEGL